MLTGSAAAEHLRRIPIKSSFISKAGRAYSVRRMSRGFETSMTVAASQKVESTVYAGIGDEDVDAVQFIVITRNEVLHVGTARNIDLL